MITGCMELGAMTGHEAGRLLLRQLWQAHYRTPMPEIAVTDRGKPYFVDSPIHFSIAHTRRHAFCVLSERNVGIDAEEMDRDINLRLADKILSDFERAQYDRSPDPRLALLTFWVLKEADAKRTGEGLRGYPRHTRFSLEDPAVTQKEGCLVAVLTDA